VKNLRCRPNFWSDQYSTIEWMLVAVDTLIMRYVTGDNTQTDQHVGSRHSKPVDVMNEYRCSIVLSMLCFLRCRLSLAKETVAINDDRRSTLQLDF